MERVRSRDERERQREWERERGEWTTDALMQSPFSPGVLLQVVARASEDRVHTGKLMDGACRRACMRGGRVEQLTAYRHARVSTCSGVRDLDVL